MTDLAAVGDRIAALVDAARASPDPRAGPRTEELLALVTDLYSAGLARIAEVVSDEAPEVMDGLLADPLVGSLLKVHGLHPDDLADRVEQALDSVRPLLATHGGDVELLDIDRDLPAVRLRLLGSCDGCPSSASTLQFAVEEAILTAAPEIILIDVDEPLEAAAPGGGRATDGTSIPITLGPKPIYETCPAEPGRP